MFEQAGQGNMDAIGGCSIDEQKTVGSALHTQWPTERERVAGAAVVLFGCDDKDLAVRSHGIDERLQARRKITIVVGNQYAHLANKEPIAPLAQPALVGLARVVGATVREVVHPSAVMRAKQQKKDPLVALLS